jgi:hypothetical protein
MQPIHRKLAILDYLKAGELEVAHKQIAKFQAKLKTSDVEQAIEILRETQEEISDLGLVHTDVYPLGGAWARFENDSSILIWGISDQFGACDKELAAEMIRKECPEKEIKIK